MLATALLVAAANTLGFILIERHTDRLMRRTMQRPLPADRLSPQFAFSFGLTLLVLAVPALWVFGNPLCLGLGLLAFGSYVFVYTPL